MRSVTSLAFVLSTFLATTPLAAQTIVFDPHLDLPKSAAEAGWTGLADPISQFDLERARKGGLTTAAIALFVPQGARNPAALVTAQRDAVARDAAIHAIADGNATRAAFARSPADVRRIVAGGKFAVVESLLNAWPLGEDLDAFDRWHARGVSIVGFVHAGHNQFADSSRPVLQLGDRVTEHNGLSPLGRAAVKRLNDLGVLIDVSQLSDAAFDQVLALSRAPVIASHSDVRTLADSPRNLTDAQLDALKAKGGVIAINAFSAYLRARSPETAKAVVALQGEYGLSPTDAKILSPEKQVEYDHRYHEIVGKEPKASVEELINAVDYAVKRIGIDHVALSSDFNHGGGVTGWSDVGETGNVTAALTRHGYTPAQIAKLWGGNVLRVWQAAIDARDPAYKSRLG
ncbi:MAG: dipeptidase [Pseudomonadota bacterium]|uniref:dipeptidase n=1 Tax=Sphingomonas sp. ERG5 TaxID=1381597 RepID=UPI00068CCDD1|nr:dipeptidase [Sphingomonas sp. ERG5]